jgi:peptide/nickel transport system permease protein
MLAKNRSFQLCLGVVLFIVAVGVIGPYLTLDPNKATGSRYQPPSSAHILGCDLFSQDVLAQLVAGTRNSLIVGFLAGLIGLLIAFAVGGLSAYVGGLTDETVNTFTNVFLVLPIIPILIILSAAMMGEGSLYTVAGLIGLITWAGSARALRSQIMSLKERDFVNLARISGKSTIGIIFRELFPNMLSYVFISFCNMFGGAIMAEAGISLLGLGPPPNVPTLGNMLHWAIATQSVEVGVWWWFIPPGIVLISFTGALLAMGSVIDDVLNPKLRGVV